MRISTMKGMAAGGMLGLTLGTGLMMTPRGKRMKKILMREGMQLAKDLMECWT